MAVSINQARQRLAELHLSTKGSKPELLARLHASQHSPVHANPLQHALPRPSVDPHSLESQLLMDQPAQTIQEPVISRHAAARAAGAFGPQPFRFLAAQTGARGPEYPLHGPQHHSISEVRHENARTLSRSISLSNSRQSPLLPSSLPSRHETYEAPRACTSESDVDPILGTDDDPVMEEIAKTPIFKELYRNVAAAQLRRARTSNVNELFSQEAPQSRSDEVQLLRDQSQTSSIPKESHHPVNVPDDRTKPAGSQVCFAAPLDEFIIPDFTQLHTSEFSLNEERLRHAVTRVLESSLLRDCKDHGKAHSTPPDQGKAHSTPDAHFDTHSQNNGAKRPLGKLPLFPKGSSPTRILLWHVEVSRALRLNGWSTTGVINVHSLCELPERLLDLSHNDRVSLLARALETVGSAAQILECLHDEARAITIEQSGRSCMLQWSQSFSCIQCIRAAMFKRPLNEAAKMLLVRSSLPADVRHLADAFPSANVSDLLSAVFRQVESRRFASYNGDNPWGRGRGRSSQSPTNKDHHSGGAASGNRPKLAMVGQQQRSEVSRVMTEFLRFWSGCIRCGPRTSGPPHGVFQCPQIEICRTCGALHASSSCPADAAALSCDDCSKRGRSTPACLCRTGKRARYAWRAGFLAVAKGVRQMEDVRLHLEAFGNAMIDFKWASKEQVASTWNQFEQGYGPSICAVQCSELEGRDFVETEHPRALALIDGGARGSFMERSLEECLGFEGPREPVHVPISVADGTAVRILGARNVNFTLRAQDGSLVHVFVKVLISEGLSMPLIFGTSFIKHPAVCLSYKPTQLLVQGCKVNTLEEGIDGDLHRRSSDILTLSMSLATIVSWDSIQEGKSTASDDTGGFLAARSQFPHSILPVLTPTTNTGISQYSCANKFARRSDFRHSLLPVLPDAQATPMNGGRNVFPHSLLPVNQLQAQASRIQVPECDSSSPASVGHVPRNGTSTSISELFGFAKGSLAVPHESLTGFMASHPTTRWKHSLLPIAEDQRSVEHNAKDVASKPMRTSHFHTNTASICPASSLAVALDEEHTQSIDISSVVCLAESRSSEEAADKMESDPEDPHGIMLNVETQHEECSQHSGVSMAAMHRRNNDQPALMADSSRPGHAGSHKGIGWNISSSGSLSFTDYDALLETIDFHGRPPVAMQTLKESIEKFTVFLRRTDEAALVVDMLCSKFAAFVVDPVPFDAPPVTCELKAEHQRRAYAVQRAAGGQARDDQMAHVLDQAARGLISQIEPSSDEHLCNSNHMCVPKKSTPEGKRRTRSVLDMRGVNLLLSAEPMVHVLLMRVLHKMLRTYKFISDARDMFWGFVIAQYYRFLFAFTAPDGSRWAWNRMVQGFLNGSPIAQRWINSLLAELHDYFGAYIDNLGGSGDEFASFLHATDRLLEICISSHIQLNARDTIFSDGSISIFQFRIDSDGLIGVDEAYLSRFPSADACRPEFTSGISRALGVAGYISMHFSGFECIKLGLLRIMKENSSARKRITWDEASIGAWDDFLAMLLHPALRQAPREGADVAIEADGSAGGIGYSILQPSINPNIGVPILSSLGDESLWMVVARGGVVLSHTERNWPTAETELWAQLKPRLSFSYLMISAPTIFHFCDHRNLVEGLKSPKRKIWRWASSMFAHRDVRFVHVPGQTLFCADAFSRLWPTVSEEQERVLQQLRSLWPRLISEPTTFGFRLSKMLRKISACPALIDWMCGKGSHLRLSQEGNATVSALSPSPSRRRVHLTQFSNIRFDWPHTPSTRSLMVRWPNDPDFAATALKRNILDALLLVPGDWCIPRFPNAWDRQARAGWWRALNAIAATASSMLFVFGFSTSQATAEATIFAWPGARLWKDCIYDDVLLPSPDGAACFCSGSVHLARDCTSMPFCGYCLIPHAKLEDCIGKHKSCTCGVVGHTPIACGFNLECSARFWTFYTLEMEKLTASHIAPAIAAVSPDFGDTAYSLRALARRAKRAHLQDCDYWKTRLAQEDSQLRSSLLSALDSPTPSWPHQLLADAVSAFGRAFKSFLVVDGHIYRHNLRILGKPLELVLTPTVAKEWIERAHALSHRTPDGIAYIAARHVFIFRLRELASTERAACATCVRLASDALLVKAPNRWTAYRPWQIAVIDCVEFPQAAHDLNHAIICVDKFSGFVFSLPCGTPSAATTMSMFKSIEMRYGRFFDVLSFDNGSEFANEAVFAQLRALGCIPWPNSSSIAPFLSGAAEAAVKRISRMIRLILAEADADTSQWPQFLEEATYLVNLTPQRHSNIGSSSFFIPFDVFLDRLPVVPDSFLLEAEASADSVAHFLAEDGSSNELIREAFTRFRRRLLVQEAQLRDLQMRSPSDSSTGPPVRPGNVVLRRTSVKRPSKLGTAVGSTPFRVLSVDGTRSMIKNLLTGDVGTSSTRLLRPLLQRYDEPDSTTRSEPVSSHSIDAQGSPSAPTDTRSAKSHAQPNMTHSSVVDTDVWSSSLMFGSPDIDANAIPSSMPVLPTATPATPGPLGCPTLWEVKEIIGTKVSKRGRRLYEVLWDDAIGSSTWEPGSHFKTPEALAMIRAFKERGKH